MAEIDALLAETLSRQGSDLHVMAGDLPRVRVHGDLAPLRQERLAPDFVVTALHEIMPPKAAERLERLADFRKRPALFSRQPLAQNLRPSACRSPCGETGPPPAATVPRSAPM